MKKSSGLYLSAREASAELAVSPATLYAYVSRGLLPSYRQGIKRTRLYRRDDVERLTRLRGPDEITPPTTGAPDAWIPYV